jgi:peptidoglycan/xylan/chitin deacetylase (PgdA/CDA1 family)
MVTQGDGTQARATIARVEPVSLRANLLRFWFQVDPESASHLRQILIQVGSGSQTFESFAYQAIVEVDGIDSYESEYLKPGEWVSITVGPASLASFGAGLVDFGAVRDFAVSVTDDGLGSAILYFGGMQVVPAETAFPRGVVSLTFDDGLASTYQHALPVMSRRGLRGTAYLIHELVGETGYLATHELDELQVAGWELAAHADSVRVHNAPHGLIGIPRTDRLEDWRRDRAWLSSRGSRGFNNLALPQGLFDQTVLVDLAGYGAFKTVRTSNFRSIETLPVADPYRLRSTGYDVTVPLGPPDRLGSLKWRIDQIRSYGGWMILTFHEVVERDARGSAISISTFSDLVEYIAQQNVPVRTVAEVWAKAGSTFDSRLPPRQGHVST